MNISNTINTCRGYTLGTCCIYCYMHCYGWCNNNKYSYENNNIFVQYIYIYTTFYAFAEIIKYD